MMSREGKGPQPLSDVPGLPTLTSDVAKRRGYRFVPDTCEALWWTDSAICFSIAGRDSAQTMTVPRGSVAVVVGELGDREPVVKAHCFGRKTVGVA